MSRALPARNTRALPSPKTYMPASKALSAGLLMFALLSRTASPTWASAPEAATPTIVWPTQGWQVSTPEEQGMDPAALAKLVHAIGERRQDSLLIVRHGKIILDAYYAPYAAGIPHDLRSVTKSVIGTLVAIALRQGLIDTVEQPVVPLFPDKQISNLDDKKKSITLQNLLDMNSGLDWRERAYTPDETISQMYRSPDPTEFVLSRPMSITPGSAFEYDSGNPYVLSAIISRKTGKSAFAYAQSELFAPLGIRSAHWDRLDAQGVTDGESGLFLTPREMAKIGYLYLHDGAWDGRRIIPSTWVARAKAGPVVATGGFNYANLWWSLPAWDAYMARGRHSQLILVLPSLDVVAVMTGYMRDTEYYPVTSLINYIARAERSTAPLPPDAAGQALLAAAIREAATEKPSNTAPPPPIAQEISGKTYRFDDNVLRLKTLSVTLVGADPRWEVTIASTQPDTPAERFSGPLGLDGRFGLDHERRGINAVKGRWPNDHLFSVSRRILGHGETQRWNFIFEGRTLDLQVTTTDGFTAELHGERAD